MCRYFEIIHIYLVELYSDNETGQNVLEITLWASKKHVIQFSSPEDGVLLIFIVCKHVYGFIFLSENINIRWYRLTEQWFNMVVYSKGLMMFIYIMYFVFIWLSGLPSINLGPLKQGTWKRPIMLEISVDDDELNCILLY